MGDAFSAPELIENPKLLDPRCDIYSLGACWFWLLTGKAPKGLDWHVALRDVEGVSDDYARVLLRCLMSSDSRYASMTALSEDVGKLSAGKPPSTKPDELADDDALVLGLIASECTLSDEFVAVHSIKSDAQSALSRVAFGVALRRLLRLQLVETFEHAEWNDAPYKVVRLVDAGERWVEAHQAHVTSLLTRLRKEAPPADPGDIPF